MPEKQLDLKNDGLWKLMWHMSLPGIFGMLVLSVNTFVDSLYVGHFIGTEALAGVSLYFPLSLITTSLIVLICSGGASILSRAIGSGDWDTQQKLFSTVFTLALIISLFLTGIGLLFSKTLIELMGGSGKTLDAGSAYYRICSMGSFFTIAGLSFSALIRAEGKMKQAMTYTAVSVILNLVLAPVFINLLSMGIEGAAWASNTGMFVYFLLTANYFVSGKASFYTGKLHLQLDRNLTKNILLIGLSSFFLQAGNFIRQTFIFKSIAYYGTAEDVAFFGAVFRIFVFSVTPVFGILQALQPIVGINYGAGNYERCAKSVTVFRIGSGLFLFLIWIPLFIFSQPILSLMLPDRMLSITDLTNFRIILITLPLLPVASSGIIFFQAIGKGKVSSILSLSRELILFIPLILLFPFLFGTNGIYYGIAVENAIYIFVMLVFTLYEFNKLKSKSITLTT
jgi:putative MATE family efflux protein